MKFNFCQFRRKRISPFSMIIAALVLAGLMVLTDAEPTTCFIALIFLGSLTDTSRSCRLFGRRQD